VTRINMANTNIYFEQGGNEMVVADGGTITLQSGATLDASGLTNGTPGAGFSGGTGTVIKSSVEKIGGIIRTTFLIDLTGLGSSTTDLDIIGVGASAAYFGQITAAKNGTILTGRMTCLEVPFWRHWHGNQKQRGAGRWHYPHYIFDRFDRAGFVDY